MAFRSIVESIARAGARIIRREVVQAFRQQILGKSAQEFAAKGMGSITNQFANRNRMKVDEARAILGVKDSATLKEVNERFERLFNANDVAKGGSFYLQSKIYRAQQTLSEHVVEKARERASAKDKGEDMAEALKPSEAKDK